MCVRVRAPTWSCWEGNCREICEWHDLADRRYRGPISWVADWPRSFPKLLQCRSSRWSLPRGFEVADGDKSDRGGTLSRSGCVEPLGSFSLVLAPPMTVAPNSGGLSVVEVEVNVDGIFFSASLRYPYLCRFNQGQEEAGRHSVEASQPVGKVQACDE